MSVAYLLAHLSPPSNPSKHGHSEAIWCSKWAKLPDGGETVVTAGADHTIKLWNPVSGAKPSKTIVPEIGLGVVGLDVDPSENGATFMLSSTLDSVISRWDMNGNLEAKKELGPAESWTVAIDPNSAHFATAGVDAAVRVMSSASETFGEQTACLSATGGFGTTVEYSQDGKSIAVASDTGYITLFDAVTGQLLSTFSAHSSPIRSIAMTSSLLVSGADDQSINIFDLRALMPTQDGKRGGGGRKGQVASLMGHAGWVVSVNARNDRMLASGSSDGTIKLWDLASFGSAVGTLRDHTGDVWSLAWKPEQGPFPIEGLAGASGGIGGGHLVSAGEDGTLRWWRGGG